MIQAHIPTYIMSWLIGVANPVVYVLFCQRYRKAATEKFQRVWRVALRQDHDNFQDVHL